MRRCSTGDLNWLADALGLIIEMRNGVLTAPFLRHLLILAIKCNFSESLGKDYSGSVSVAIDGEHRFNQLILLDSLS